LCNLGAGAHVEVQARQERRGGRRQRARQRPRQEAAQAALLRFGRGGSRFVLVRGEASRQRPRPPLGAARPLLELFRWRAVKAAVAAAARAQAAEPEPEAALAQKVGREGGAELRPVVVAVPRDGSGDAVFERRARRVPQLGFGLCHKRKS
jgi:hypothetical protein